MTLPPEAVTAAALWLHDEYCGDGETTATCGRWRSGNYPPGTVTHVGYYEAQAARMLLVPAPLITAAERDRIIALARDLHAGIPASHPEGAVASFASYLETEATP